MMITTLRKELRVLRYPRFIPVICLSVLLMVPMSMVRADGPDFVPYTVTIQEYQLTSGGTARPPSKYTFALRSDGSRAVAAPLADESSVERILTFSSGKEIYIFEAKRQKSTTFNPSRNPTNAIPDPRNNCKTPAVVQEKFLGIEQVGKYRAVKIALGPVTRWLALDYGCAPLQEKAEWSDGQASEKRLVSLAPGEPSATLFNDPAGFQEVPPSVLFPSPFMTKQDAYYYKHRP
jgi:hypothetical protein